MQIARSWLRFHSCLIEPAKTRFADKRLRTYERWLRDERGIASSTIEERSKHASYFLKWLAAYPVRLRHLSPSHVERYLETNKAKGLALSTRITRANSLRNFLRHSEARGSIRTGLCEAVPVFVRPKYAFTERGPSWSGVGRMISFLSRVKPTDIRDYAMILLMALYGLRAGEIRGLRMTDVDFKNRTLTVGRRKTRRTQRFPLTPKVLNALKKYINRARPESECPSLFLATDTACRPISASGLYHRTRDLFRKSAVKSPHKGPHAFRHACANQLMDKGASVRDIAAFLGHRNPRSVREYARYNVEHLRQIAEFSLKDFL
jgi:integrase/recombinase XerD